MPFRFKSKSRSETSLEDMDKGLEKSTNGTAPMEQIKVSEVQSQPEPTAQTIKELSKRDPNMFSGRRRSFAMRLHPNAGGAIRVSRSSLQQQQNGRHRPIPKIEEDHEMDCADSVGTLSREGSQLGDHLDTTTGSPLMRDTSLIDHANELRKHSKLITQSRLEWIHKPSKILIIKKFRDPHVTHIFKHCVRCLMDEFDMTCYVEDKVLCELPVVLDDDFRPYKERCKATTLSETSKPEVDFIMTLGGDGTILYISSFFQRTVPPVLSFNLGSLGFLTPFNIDEFCDVIDNCINGKLTVTLRSRLDAHIVCNSSNAECEAVGWHVLNEIVIDRGPSPYLSDLEVYADGIHITTVLADGLIIATPTGSTAYSVSAGGSMVHPSINCICLTPICPHSLSFRPILLPDTVELEVLVPSESRNTAWVSFDGRNRRELRQGDAVYVRVGRWPIPTMQKDSLSADWFSSLSNCLNWNDRMRQKAFAQAHLVGGDDTMKDKDAFSGPLHMPKV
eukprot:Clim_evm6s221 gene=Clim_evmTU6s221